MAQSSRRGSGGMLPVGVTSSSHFCSPSVFSQTASAFASSSAAFSSHTTATTSLFQRSASPTRVNLYSPNPAANSVRFSFEHRPISPGRSIAAVPGRDRPVVKKQSPLPQKKTCMCSPTTHPGSFRCSLHKGMGSAVSSSSNRLNAKEVRHDELLGPDRNCGG